MKFNQSVQLYLNSRIKVINCKNNWPNAKKSYQMCIKSTNRKWKNLHKSNSKLQKYPGYEMIKW